MNLCLSLEMEVEMLTFYSAGTKGRDQPDQRFYEISKIVNGKMMKKIQS